VRRYRAAHPEKHKQQWRASNQKQWADSVQREKGAARVRQWQQANREYVNQMVRARRTKSGRITKAQIEELLVYYGTGCVYCPQPATGFDHLQPVARGGQTTVDNLAPACAHCNSVKRDKPIWIMLVAA
jgi:5-methylcytosine-specific restriction endonuclease McrA